MENYKLIFTTYNKDNISRQNLKNLDEILLGDSTTVNWLQVISDKNEEIIDEIGKKFNLHPLVIEDIKAKDHMPKLQDYDDYLLLVIEGIKLINNDQLEIENYRFILFENLVISFQPADTAIFDHILVRLQEGSNIRKNGADDLLYALTDKIVDDYFLVIEQIGYYIDDVEDKVLLNPKKEVLREIYKIKRNLIYIRKTLWPMRNAISNLSKNDYDLIDDKTLYYFRDIYDNIIQMIDIIETYRDICSGMLDTYLSSISNKTNDIMKVLTIFSTIFIPLTFLAGVYGMNFKYLPELNWKYGYLSFWIISIIIIGVLLRYFKKKKWF